MPHFLGRFQAGAKSSFISTKSPALQVINTFLDLKLVA